MKYFILSYLLSCVSLFSFEKELNEIIRDVERKNGKISIYLYDINGGKKIFGYMENLGLNPASNIKILTTGAALWKLGTDFIFSTEFYADQPPRNGTLSGNLYIKGYGDPTIVTETLYAIGQNLKARGVREITNDIIIDNSFFLSSPQINEKFPATRAYNPPITALSLNRNAFSLSVYPTAVGQPPKIVLESEGLNVNIVNNALTAKGNNSSISIDQKTLDKEYIYINGTIGEDANVKNIYRSVTNPSEYFGVFFKEALNSHKIKFGGSVREGILPAKRHLIYTHKSRGISHIIKDMNEYSNNFYAEILLRTMGAISHGAHGTEEKGLIVVRNFLSHVGIKDNYMIENGSGLSLSTKFSTGQFGIVLQYLHNNFTFGSEFVSSLSITGMRGTLRRRYQDVEGLMRAKSGFLDYIYALSGYALGNRGTLIFSIIINAPISYNESLEIFNNFGTIITMDDKSTRFVHSEVEITGEQKRFVKESCFFKRVTDAK